MVRQDSIKVLNCIDGLTKHGKTSNPFPYKSVLPVDFKKKSYRIENDNPANDVKICKFANAVDTAVLICPTCKGIIALIKERSEETPNILRFMNL